MAEKGAFLTGTVRNKPSIFDVVASYSLNATFHPALRRFADYIVKKNPDKLSWITKYYDEIFLIIDGLLQQHYLRQYNGSLAEVFYGLARKNTTTGQYDKRDFIMSFVTLVILPYLGRKLDRRMAAMKEDLLDGNIPRIDAKRHQTIVSSYYNAKGIYELAKLAQYVAFLTKFSSTGILMQRICNQQLEYSQPLQVDWTWRDAFSRKISTSKVLSDLLFRGLELSAFFLQFIQWFQNEAKTTDISALPKPPPPTVQIEYDGICPICLQKWETPTVVGVSGYVYCYTCILHYFDTRKQEDPVTKCAACIDDLRHLYED